MKIKKYNFFHFINALEQHTSLKNIQLKSTLRFHFSSSDLEIFRRKNQTFQVWINFLGLLNEASPISETFKLSIYRELKKDLISFIEIFDHVFYMLFYQVWLKHHQLMVAKSLGHFKKYHQNIFDFKLLITQFFKNEKVDIHVENFFQVWQEIYQKSFLSNEKTKIGNSVIGTRVLEASKTLKICIFFYHSNDAIDFYNTPNRITELKRRMVEFLDTKDYRIFLTFALNQSRFYALGEEPLFLGCFLGIGIINPSRQVQIFIGNNI